MILISLSLKSWGALWIINTILVCFNNGGRSYFIIFKFGVKRQICRMDDPKFRHTDWVSRSLAHSLLSRSVTQNRWKDLQGRRRKKILHYLKFCYVHISCSYDDTCMYYWIGSIISLIKTWLNSKQGLVALTSTALARSWSPTNMASSFLFSSLYLISLGQGGYNPSLQAFGADQLDHDDAELPTGNAKAPSSSDEKPKKKSLFFQWWYFGVCSGSLLGVTVMSYIQDNFGWVLGFAIPMCAMVSSVALFACGTRIYRYKRDVEEDQVEKRRFVKVMEIFKATATRLMCCRNVVTLSNGNSDDDVELE